MPWDRSKYPANWKSIRAAILKRAGNRCEAEECGVENGQLIRRAEEDQSIWRYCDTTELAALAAGETELEIQCASFDYHWGRSVKVVLTVAHLDHDLENNRKDNLKALCQRCHLRLDRYQHADNATRTRRKKQTAGMDLMF